MDAKEILTFAERLETKYPVASSLAFLLREFVAGLPTDGNTIGPGPLQPRWVQGISQPDEYGAVELEGLYNNLELPEVWRTRRYIIPSTLDIFKGSLTDAQKDCIIYNVIQMGPTIGFPWNQERTDRPVVAVVPQRIPINNSLSPHIDPATQAQYRLANSIPWKSAGGAAAIAQPTVSGAVKAMTLFIKRLEAGEVV